MVELNHTGSSTVTASAGEEVSSNADLSAFEIVPGTLSPAISPEVTSYETTVGTSVDQLSINALPARAPAGGAACPPRACAILYRFGALVHPYLRGGRGGPMGATVSIKY